MVVARIDDEFEDVWELVTSYHEYEAMLAKVTPAHQRIMRIGRSRLDAVSAQFAADGFLDTDALRDANAYAKRAKGIADRADISVVWEQMMAAPDPRPTAPDFAL